MIRGIGVDIIEINRFALWHTYATRTLLRVFSQEEINYCLQDVTKSAERFAVRFAAREALYKALSYAYPDVTIPFLTLCKYVTITKIGSRPYLVLADECGIDVQDLVIHLSLSHADTVAVAFVVVE
jgi:holo-[acyl-carrier protein] synthase